MAALAMFLLLLDGPFLQRASSVQIISRANVAKLSIPVSPSPFLLGATALITTHNGDKPDIYTPLFAQAAQGYNARMPISIPKLEYLGTVTMDLVAPGFDVSCMNGSSSYRIQSMKEYIEPSECSGLNCPPYNQTMFKINVDFQSNGYSGQGQNAILLHTLYKSTPGGNGTLSWRNCTLNEAIIRHPVKIDNRAVTLQPMSLAENRTQYLILRSREWNQFGAKPSTIGGLWIALNNQYQTSAERITQPPAPYTLKNENAIADLFFAGGEPNSYDVRWFDPIDVIIAAANELALRTAINLTNISINMGQLPTAAQPEITYPNLTSVNRSISQVVTATMVSTEPIYYTDLGWLISGFLMILLACIGVAPLYWAWWRLERYFTLNPLEVSKAFDAPLLRLANTDTSPSAWPQDLKIMRIQYGMVATTEGLGLNDTKGTEISQSSSIPDAGARKFRKVD